MRIAIYGREFNNSVLPYVQEVFNVLDQYQTPVYVYRKYLDFIRDKIKLPNNIEAFEQHTELLGQTDVLISLGGDGTLLDTLSLVRDSGIPVIGINFGRLGFLASINKDEIKTAIEALKNKEYSLDKRTLLSLDSTIDLFEEENFALNDVTIHKRDTSAMMIIHAYLNGDFLNSYWADGLILATPTGSTAYSLSCGGPIVFPQSGYMVVTPVSPHNLNVRPIVLSDSNELSFEIEGRSSKYLLTCDSRTEVIDNSVRVSVKKASFGINLVRLSNESYLSTLRNKLLWGIDTRNY